MAHSRNFCLKSLCFIAFLGAGNAALAHDPVVTAAKATQSGDAWSFSVTLRHPDTGWDHYADGWDVITETGETLGIRELAHPHVNEQPFTRSLGGVSIPNGTTRVGIRARCSVDGWTDTVFWLNLK